MEILIALILIVVLITYSTILHGWIFYKFWHWFVLPVFPELPELTFYMALGLATFTTLLKATVIDELDDQYKDGAKKYTALLWPWVTLLFGWVIHVFIS